MHIHGMSEPDGTGLADGEAANVERGGAQLTLVHPKTASPEGS